MVGPVQADVQEDLASRHARRLPAGEDEVDQLFKVVRRQARDVRGVLVVDLPGALREGVELGQHVRTGRPKRVRRPLQMMLENPVHRVDVVQDEQHERGGCVVRRKARAAAAAAPTLGPGR